MSLPVRPFLTMPPVPTLKQLCTFRSLEDAWVKVRTSAFKSDSSETRAEAQAFSLNASSSLRSLQVRLRRGSFKFLPAKGVLISKPGSTKKRPVVIAPIESRIVQRAILELVQTVPKIRSELTAGFNFGGVPGEGFGVPGAIAKAVTCAQQGGYFIRTDIKSFFTAVPRTKVVDDICCALGGDEDFLRLFRASAETEISDAAKYGKDIGLFPVFEMGVAQGSSLSPLLCNYLLREFDREFNQRGITCIRYIDDFILFGKNQRDVKKAFKAALVSLRVLELTAYDPFNATDAAKAEHGPADKGFDFLGCHVFPHRVRPTQEKWNSIIHRVQHVFDECLKECTDPNRAIFSSDLVSTFSGATIYASNMLRAWGNTYSFCSDDRLMNSIDQEIGKRFIEFRKSFAQKISKKSVLERSKAMGLFSLLDCKFDDNPGSARELAMTRLRTE